MTGVQTCALPISCSCKGNLIVGCVGIRISSVNHKYQCVACFHAGVENCVNFGRMIIAINNRYLHIAFNNSYQLQVGFEKPFRSTGNGLLARATKDVTWRTGYVYDHSPVPEQSIGPLFPDTNRHSWTIGLTKPVGSFDMSMYYQFMQFINTSTNVDANWSQFTNGEYRNFANLFGAGMRWRFGGHDGKAE